MLRSVKPTNNLHRGCLEIWIESKLVKKTTVSGDNGLPGRMRIRLNSRFSVLNISGLPAKIAATIKKLWGCLLKDCLGLVISDAQTWELCVTLKAIETILTDQIPKRRRPLIQSNPSAELWGHKIHLIYVIAKTPALPFFTFLIKKEI